MPVEEARRAELFDRLAGVIGREPTGTLFAMFFEEVATRADVDGLRSHLDLRLDALRNELVATLERGLRDAVVGQTRIIIFSLMTAFVAVAGLAFGAARLV